MNWPHEIFRLALTDFESVHRIVKENNLHITERPYFGKILCTIRDDSGNSIEFTILPKETS